MPLQNPCWNRDRESYLQFRCSACAWHHTTPHSTAMLCMALTPLGKAGSGTCQRAKNLFSSQSFFQASI